uniref:Uncharacterized protein n=1 Tax=Anguilla anguilla TaxID=7936 RepID=A0A0E9W3L0_ANGAN
MRGNKVFGS